MPEGSRKRAAVFLDRDGTLNEEVGYLDSLDKLTIIPGAVEAVRLINRAGLLAIVVTNQSGIARGFFDEAFVISVHDRIRTLFYAREAVIDGFYFCPHHPTEGQGPYLQACPCRKPAPGLLIQAAADWNIDLEDSYMIGDMLKDVAAGQRAGSRGILVKTGYGGRIAGEVGVQPDYVAEDILDAVRWIIEKMDGAK